MKNLDICESLSPQDNLILREIENVLSGSVKIVEDEEDDPTDRLLMVNR